MKILKYFIILVVTTGIVLTGNSVQAQSGHVSAASLGMGGTGTAFVDTYHANFINPANLLLNSDSKPSFSIGILGGVSATAGGPLANVSVYNDYFTSGDLVNTADALDNWFGSDVSVTKRLGLELDVVPIGMAWRGDKSSFSLALRHRTLFSGSMNRGYAQVLLEGVTQEKFSTAKPVNFNTNSLMFSEVSAGFSMKILELPSLPGIGKNVKLYAGIAPKYIVPIYTSGIDFKSTLQHNGNQIVNDFEYTFQTVGGLTSQFEDYYQASRDENFDGDLGDFIDPEGSDIVDVQGAGYGVDLGGTIEMDLAGPLAGVFSFMKGTKKLTVSLAITDIGSVTYDNNAGSFSADETFTWDGADFDDGFDEALSDSISKEIYLNYEPGSEKEITQDLPTKVSLGSHLQLGKLSVALDLSKGMNEVAMNSKRLAMGIGAEYKFFNFIPLRAGYRTGGLTSSSITAGTGLEFKNFEFTVGALTVPNSQKRGSGIGAAWSGLVFRF